MSLRHNNQGPHLLGSVCFKCWPLWNCLLLTVMTDAKEGGVTWIFFFPWIFVTERTGFLSEMQEAIWERGQTLWKETLRRCERQGNIRKRQQWCRWDQIPPRARRAEEELASRIVGDVALEVLGSALGIHKRSVGEFGLQGSGQSKLKFREMFP